MGFIFFALEQLNFDAASLTSRGFRKGRAVVEPGANIRQSSLPCAGYSHTSMKIPRDGCASETSILLHCIYFVM